MWSQQPDIANVKHKSFYINVIEIRERYWNDGDFTGYWQGFFIKLFKCKLHKIFPYNLLIYSSTHIRNRNLEQISFRFEFAIIMLCHRLRITISAPQCDDNILWQKIASWQCGQVQSLRSNNKFNRGQKWIENYFPMPTY